MSKSIKVKFVEFCDDCVSPEMAREEVADVKKIFYAGALAAQLLMSEAAIKGNKAMFDALHEELLDYFSEQGILNNNQH